MSVQLTHDSDYLLCALYSEYMERRKNGLSKADAKIFGGADWIQESLMPEWSFDDVDETCKELSRQGLVSCQFANNSAQLVFLEVNGLVYMENRFKNNLSKIADNMAKIKALIPFI